MPPFALLLESHAPLPLLLLLVTLLAFVILRKGWPVLRLPWALLLTLCWCIGLFFVASQWAPWWMREWLTLAALTTVRWDLLLLLGLSLGFLFALQATSGHFRGAVLFLLFTVAFSLMLYAVVAFGYFLATGLVFDLALFQHALRHLPDLLPMIVGDPKGVRLVLLSLPVLLVVVVFFLLHAPRVRSWVQEQAPTARLPWRSIGGALPVVLVLALPSLPPDPSAGPRPSFVHLAQELWYGASWTPPTISEPPLDAQALQWVATDQRRHLNVVLVVLESARSRSVTPYTPALPTTPFLDSLAQHSLLFEQMHAVVPYTNKALVSLLTGTYPYPDRDFPETQPEGLLAPGLPALLQPHGYASAFFTSATLSYEDKGALLRNMGFQTIAGADELQTQGFYPKDYFGYEDRVMLAPALQWVEDARAQTQPFFLTLLTLTGHHPYDTPPGRLRTFADDPSLNAYYNALAYTDDFLRDFFHALKERGLLETTLFLVVGDHGEAFGEHGQRTHGDVIWDEALHVPALLYQPRLFRRGQRVRGWRQHIDVAPTLADALGYQTVGGTLPGVSLLQPVAPNRALLHHTFSGRQALALRQDSLKFVYHFWRRPMQVFNVVQDPLEQRDLAPAFPDATLNEVRHTLTQWHARTRQAYE